MSDAKLEAELLKFAAKVTVDCRVELFGYSGLDNGDTYLTE